MNIQRFRLRKLMAGVILFHAVLCSYLSSAQTLPQGIVTMKVLDSYGVPFPYKIDSFYDAANPSLKLPVQIRDLVISGVPYGSYHLKMSAKIMPTAYPVIEAGFLVIDPIVLKVFTVSSSGRVENEGIPDPVKGRMTPASAIDSKTMWISATPAITPIEDQSHYETAPLRADGSFVLREVCAGLYRITVLKEGVILKSVVISFPEELAKRFALVNLD